MVRSTAIGRRNHLGATLTLHGSLEAAHDISYTLRSYQLQGKSKKRITLNPQIDMETGRQITEALQLQLDAQRRLREQLEIQRNLQCRIEEQRKQLEKMFDQPKTSNNLLKTQTLDIPCNEDDPSNSLCDTQVSASEGSGNTQLSIQDKSAQESKLFNAHYYT
ncbi:putative transcription factor KAN3 isoform X2 [Prunus yedoensis var. nudiflora]|uniref:Putative transcription factor KAN3 isoform X2 n=1 Tax=Prunus yedoensis var. nudiflora TaxID=2094558 RepID=A0A314V0H7_PRUYE|nr:putative transcription factor KAN3 isoform X2 [Prunus yedoensis var. nudiflora]